MTIHARLLDTGPRSGAANMALDTIILEEVEAGLSPPTLRFLRFDPPAALVGHNQDPAAELRLDYCRQQGIEINRRVTGGGAILFTPSMLGFELFWPNSAPGLGRDFAQITARLAGLAARAITSLGAPAAFRPRNDIEINGRKVSGTGMAFFGQGWMFQGTVLVENCMERMLRALRVPVEKLKRREMQSLLQRLTFLADELGGPPGMDRLKEAIATAFAEGLGLSLAPAALSERERARLAAELAHYQSDQWIWRRGGLGQADQVLRAQSGRLNVVILPEPGRRRIKQALLTGDFFCRPQRLIMDLEGALRGAELEPDRLRALLTPLLAGDDLELIGVEKSQLVAAVAQAAAKGAAPWPGFAAEELNDIYPIAAELGLAGFDRPRTLLLPYCAKDLSCPQRHEDGCAQCGLCAIGPLYDLADELGMRPVSITSFEHLMKELGALAAQPGQTYLGSCCQAFLAKHQDEMAAAGPQGFIVGLDSLTCYDLGKHEAAYAGRFESQSRLEIDLLTRVARFLAGRG